MDPTTLPLDGSAEIAAYSSAAFCSQRTAAFQATVKALQCSKLSSSTSAESLGFGSLLEVRLICAASPNRPEGSQLTILSSHPFIQTRSAVQVVVCIAADVLQVDIATVFMHDVGSKQLITRWGSSMPSDFTSAAKNYIRIPEVQHLHSRGLPCM
jgi:hypothetical protein